MPNNFGNTLSEISSLEVEWSVWPETILLVEFSLGILFPFINVDDFPLLVGVSSVSVVWISMVLLYLECLGFLVMITWSINCQDPSLLFGIFMFFHDPCFFSLIVSEVLEPVIECWYSNFLFYDHHPSLTPRLDTPDLVCCSSESSDFLRLFIKHELLALSTIWNLDNERRFNDVDVSSSWETRFDVEWSSFIYTPLIGWLFWLWLFVFIGIDDVPLLVLAIVQGPDVDVLSFLVSITLNIEDLSVFVHNVVSFQSEHLEPSSISGPDLQVA